jgi:hypothetical protein
MKILEMTALQSTCYCFPSADFCRKKTMIMTPFIGFGSIPPPPLSSQLQDANIFLLYREKKE